MTIRGWAEFAASEFTFCAADDALIITMALAIELTAGH